MLAKHYPTPPDAWWEARQRYEVVDLGYETPCWRWLLSLNNGGYGQIAFRPHGHALNCVAHRIYFERVHGPVPIHLQLDHLCRNKACVNPDHLEVVTAAENMRRALMAGPKATHCLRGHAFSEANTYRPRPTRRVCRACRQILAREYYYRGKAAA